MTGLLEMSIRLGGDPRELDDFKALQRELAKLEHPACPDVDWVVVEALCLRLFAGNGAELHTAVALALARSQRLGVAGMREGLALLASLLEQGPRLWPGQVNARIGLLDALFGQLQALLRALPYGLAEVSGLEGLAAELERLDHRLTPGLRSLDALRNQVHRMLQRRAGGGLPALLAPGLASRAGLSQVMPAVGFEAPGPSYTFVLEPRPARRRAVSWWLTLAMLATLAAGSAWYHWPEGRRPPAEPQPLVLRSLGLFAPGSSALQAEATKPLVDALVAIQARPGWLIVIVGHADARGDSEANQRLSLARAAAVRDWLQRMGDIPASRFALQARAADEPQASNQTVAGRAANRRVDIRLVPGFGEEPKKSPAD